MPTTPAPTAPQYDFEVIDAEAFAEAEPDLIPIEENREKIITAIQELEDEDLPIEMPGLRIFQA